jgi:glycosyltransferase involved in cell wall biosynthesis
MRIWLVTIGEPLPTDEDPRLYRTGQIAERLVARGHEVTWWASTFNHSGRTHRYPRETVVDYRERQRLVLLHGISYRRSVSLFRVLNHQQLAWGFKKDIASEPVPSVILSSLPTVELCQVATTYGRRHGVPVVLDMRDMWPDIFAELAPPWARRAALLALTPLMRAADSACSAATAITGITDAFVDWGLAHAGRSRGPLDRAFPHGYSATPPPPDVLAAGHTFWRDRGISREEFVVCFFGAVGRQVDLETVIEAARNLEKEGPRFKFVLCGNGDDLEKYRTMAGDLRNVILPGWINRGQIWALMELASIGLAPYVGGMGYESSYPNKTIEYLCGSLPCACSLGGLVRELLVANDCGFFYPNGSPDSLVARLREVASKPQRVAQMRANARRLFEERFASDKVYGDMCDYLEDLARPKAAGASGA